ncbi:DNA cytosine methyltransferase [Parapedobacter sp. 10938]|uniref:DNA cytosine methyltransferase n=1 Tax=Parapedobacter flavus TaxID=3110225 RepID=UPI002DC05E1C|nr:DNA cytosine methyltransferase [Parapedobacter sp. 10938]MEC3881917.1 DNA cytosine methyltransferase [Parapedobacter sp. 10938]
MNYLGLFSGCGGADIGFHNIGFNNIGSFDINRPALTVLKNNLGVPVYNVDLTTATVSEYIGDKSVDVVFSGAPCQGFSTAGNRIYSDPRNNLLVRGGEIALELNTKVFISENVMGSLAGNLKEYWQKLDKKFIANGFKTEFIKVNCLDIGMAQMRKRVLFFAWKGAVQSISWPSKKQPKNLGDVLYDVEAQYNNEGYIIGSDDERLKIAAKIQQTQKLSNVRGGHRAVATWEIPEVFGEVNAAEKSILESLRNLRRKNRIRDFGDADPVHIELVIQEHGEEVEGKLKSLEKKGYVRKKGIDTYDLTRTFNGKYRRLAMNEPCPTVDTRFGNPIFFLHPRENRGFTVREAARIQGFPDDFIFEGSLQEKYRMIGNAVPPPLSEIVANIVKEQLL